MRDERRGVGTAATAGPWTPDRSLLAYGMLAAAVACWAGNFVIGRAMRDAIDPVSLSFWRWATAFVVLAPFALGSLRAHAATLREHAATVAALAFTGVAAFQTLVYLGLTATTVMNAVLIASTIPVVILLLSYLGFREPISGRQAVGIAVSLAGAALVIVRGDLGALAAFRFNPGDAWMALAVPMWAGYSVLLRRAPRGVPPVALLTATTAVGVVMLVPLYAWRLAEGARVAPTPANVATILYVGVFASVVAFLLWNRGVAVVGPNRAGSFIHLMPPFGAALSFAFLGERLYAYHLIGAALVVTGLVLASRGSHQRRAGPATPPAR